eukprot:349770-Chlamydomonas_euryale.AAC.2
MAVLPRLETLPTPRPAAAAAAAAAASAPAYRGGSAWRHLRRPLRRHGRFACSRGADNRSARCGDPGEQRRRRRNTKMIVAGLPPLDPTRHACHMRERARPPPRRCGTHARTHAPTRMWYS